MPDHNHIIDWTLIQEEPEGDILVQPICILNQKVMLLRNISIGQVKVQWTHYSHEEAMWELEDVMQEAYP